MAAIEGISNLSNSGVNYQQTKPAPKVEAVSENVSQQVNQEVASQVVTVKQTEEKNGKDSDKQQNGKEEQQANPERIKKAVEKLNKKMKNTSCQFGIHDDTNRVTTKLIDKDTKDVIKEYPAEETLDMIAKAWELAGLMVDEKL